MSDQTRAAIIERLRRRQKQYAAVRSTADIAADFGDAADEIEALYAVIRSLKHSGHIIPWGTRPAPWMAHSNADDAYWRALGNGSRSTGP